MPNWTQVLLMSEGIGDLDIFNEDGETIDFQKIIPLPEYLEKTISPVREYALLNYLFTEFPEYKARSYVNAFGLFSDKDILKKKADEIIEATTGEEEINGEPITAYDLGKNYFRGKIETGCFDWYDWTNKNWGCKWNACDGYRDDDSIFFNTPWCAPEGIIVKLSKMMRKKIIAEFIYEDESMITYRCRVFNGKFYPLPSCIIEFDETSDYYLDYFGVKTIDEYEKAIEVENNKHLKEWLQFKEVKPFLVANSIKVPKSPTIEQIKTIVEEYEKALDKYEAAVLGLSA